MPASSSLPGVSSLRAPRVPQWVVVAVAAALAWPLWSWRGVVNREGLVVAESITLITSDRDNLSCALDRTVGRYRCAYRAPGEPWKGAWPRADLLAPYVAVDEHRIFLVPGLFEQPALSKRVAFEPPEGVPREHLTRFEAHCQLRLVHRVEEIQARWSNDWDWGRQTGVWIAEPVSCEVP
jgi:hypothetical protein